MGQRVFLTCSFEFSASHRLHARTLSDAENRTVFGKCNNPAGHGHNYVVDVTLTGLLEPGQAGLIGQDSFERVVDEQVIRRVDHRNLTDEVEPFSTGTNSTVEQIAVVLFGWLDGQFGSAELHRVRVWETPKTWADAYGRGGPQEVDSLD